MTDKVSVRSAVYRDAAREVDALASAIRVRQIYSRDHAFGQSDGRVCNSRDLSVYRDVQ